MLQKLFTKLLSLMLLMTITLCVQAQISTQFLGRFSIGTYNSNGGVAEISAYDPSSKRMFVVNGPDTSIRIVNLANPANPVLISTVSVKPYGIDVTSIATNKKGLIAMAIIDSNGKTNPSSIVFIDINGNFISKVRAGANTDHIIFTNDGRRLLCANEGEPNVGYTIDPEGSISIIDISGGAASLTQANVQTAGFTAFNAPATINSNIRILGRIQTGGGAFLRNSTVAEDIEPEYIAISDDNNTAWVTCQENNALAVVNINTATVTALLPLGFKNHNLAGNGLDPSDRSLNNTTAQAAIANWPVFGMYQPDGISSYRVGGQTFLVTANEGDARADWGAANNEEIRLNDVTYVLDTAKFGGATNVAALKANGALGRLNVTNRWGDFNNDGKFDSIFTFGARSFSIWNATTGALVWDSKDEFEQRTLAAFPANFNTGHTTNALDDRSDNKGPEPESVTVGRILDSTYAFVGLERIGGIMVYNITNPNAPYFVQYINSRDFSVTPSQGNLATVGDLGPEGIVFIPRNESPNGKDLVMLSNEVSGTVTIYQVNSRSAFQMQVLHASDMESGLDAPIDAPNFAAVLDTLEETYVNTVKLASGDCFIPSPFLSAGEDPSMQTPLRSTASSYFSGTQAFRAAIGRTDVAMMNIMGFQGSAFGNHEFDLGTSEVNSIIGVDIRSNGADRRWVGAQFPYLSANLNFSNDINLSYLTTNQRLSVDSFKASPTIATNAEKKGIAPSAIITMNGERVGLVGATTQVLASISSPGATTVIGGSTDNMPALAAVLQPVIDSLRSMGINKIILMSHLQQLANEKALAPLLKGVDIIIAGGSHSLCADGNDRLRPGIPVSDRYPILTVNNDNEPLAILNTTSEWKYIGRFVCDFDAQGRLIPNLLDSTINGAYAADTAMVTSLWGTYNAAFAAGTKGGAVRTLTTAISSVINLKDGNKFGKSNVFLEGRRNLVRTEETNFGNLTADANLWYARQYDNQVRVSIKNGGGIRSAIGNVNAIGSTTLLENTLANPSAGKVRGDISQLDIENSLRFNNGLVIGTVNAAGLRRLLEHGISATAPNATPGQFPQVGGVMFSYDTTKTRGAEIQSLVVTDSIGNRIDTLVRNGLLVGDTSRLFKFVTLDFLYTGGDSYPFAGNAFNRVNLDTALKSAGIATFTTIGKEQDAFAEYMGRFHATAPFNIRDTTLRGDRRIQLLNARSEGVIIANAGKNSSQSPYLVPTQPGVRVTSIITVGDSLANGYKMVGIPDGAGAYDNNNGTFTLLVNHELGNTVGAVRAHGARGAFVSRWVINKNDLSIATGSDLITKVQLYTPGVGYTLFNPADTTSRKAFGRFCSADLPPVSAFFNATTGLGTQERILLNGEEIGAEGRAFGHIATGVNAGTTWDLPGLGKFSWENAVAHPSTGNTTLVAGTDDATPGQVYMYIGTKTNTGSEVDRAGLTNGRLYGIAVTGLATEVSGSFVAPNTVFTMVDLGIVRDSSGAALNTRSNNLGVTNFLRPEDGAWDPTNPRDFYFVTTNAFNSPSRMYRLRFNDLNNLTSGGTITAVLDGTEGQQMMDNFGIDKYGHALIQEDVGNNAHLGRILEYDIITDKLRTVAIHDSARFIAGRPDFLTQDEEASGIIDVQDILGAGNFLFVDQAHYALPGELVEGGQILSMFNPSTANAFAGAGPNSSQTPYLVPTQPGVKITSIITVGDSLDNGYKMVGIPDGAGAYDNNNGTFTLLVNHELGNTVGGIRAHGARGAFVSRWVINKDNMSIVTGSDLITKVQLYTPGVGYTLFNPADTTSRKAFGRFCSADLPPVSAFFNATTGLGTQERILLNGEEIGAEGRAFGHIATGVNAGTTWDLPGLGKFSWENAVAHPSTGNTTLVAGTDDATPGQVYMYIGTKTNTGSEVDRAGLTNGRLYGIAVSGLATEVSGSFVAPNTTFTMVDLGIVRDSSGAALNTRSNNLGVTNFLRPEDGAWDPANLRDFYFVTTNAFNSPSRMYRLRFNDLNNLTSGGTITAVLDGTEGQQMMDNFGIDKYGHALIQEDVGNNAHLGRILEYDIITDKLRTVAIHDSARFISGRPGFLTQDEEASGIIDVQDILGAGQFLFVDQAHYALPGDLVEGGQILSMFNPATANAFAGIGPNSSQSPYLVPTQPGVKLTSIITVGDSLANGYKMVGIPDGAGAYDNNNGTFTLLVNHELGNTVGGIRAHGARGAFVSRWVINKNDLSIVTGSDLITKVQLYTPGVGYTLFNPADTTSRKAFGRFCSADLPPVSAFFNATTGLGTQERILLNGEEIGAEGRAFGHIATGVNAGTTWDLPGLGKFSWENAVAHPSTGNTTLVAGTDDATPGQVYMYIGTKTNTGSEVDRAGLTNGRLYGIAVTGLATEVSGSFVAPNTTFTMVDLGIVRDSSGAALNTRSNNLGVTNFLRPEDGTWDPANPKDFYFVTTNAFNSPSRMYRLRFNDLNNLTSGGTITAVLDGTEGQQMMDNLGMDKFGNALIQEDVGNNAHLGRILQYNVFTDRLSTVAIHDSTRFIAGRPGFLTQDEEASGIIDVQDILGAGQFLFVDQAHYALPGELVEGGQILSMFNPATANGKPLMTIAQARAAAQPDTIRTRGVVTRAWGRFIYIQDATGAIGVRQSAGMMVDSITSGGLKEGDSVEVVGGRSDFNNYAQVQLVTGIYGENSRVTKLASGIALPTPVTLTLKQINASGEQYESRLVRVANLRTSSTGSFAASTNYTIWDGSTPGDTMLLRVISAADTEIDDAPATSIPAGQFTFEGTLIQFCSSPTSGCTLGYQLQGVRKKEIIPQLTTFNLVTPVTNTKVVTTSGNTNVINFTWNKSANATTYKWFITSNTGNFTSPWASGPKAIDSSFAYTNGQFDTLVAARGIVRGDSVQLRWTVYAYLGADSVIAAQTNTIWIVREKPVVIPVLGAFNLLSPANNTRLQVEQGSTTPININWNKSNNATQYRWFLTGATGTFTAPLFTTGSNNAGADTVLTLTSNTVDGLLASLGVVKGDSINLKWTVYSYKAGNDSLKASQEFNIKMVRARKLQSFNLTTPADNSRLEVEANDNTPVVINWSASATGATYKWYLDLSTGNFTNPWAALASDVSGTDTKLTLTSDAIDDLLDSKAVVDGDSVNLKWTVRAFETTDSLQAAQTFNIKIVRKKTVGLKEMFLDGSMVVYPNPTSEQTTLSMILTQNEKLAVSIFDIQGRMVSTPIEKELTAGLQEIELSTSSLNNGIYFIQVSGGGKTSQIKLVVMH